VRHGIPNSTHLKSIYSLFPIIQAHHFNYEGFISPIAHSKGREGKQVYLGFEFSVLILSTLIGKKSRVLVIILGGKGERKSPPQKLPAPVGEYFKQDHDALYQQYSKTSTRRVLRVG